MVTKIGENHNGLPTKMTSELQEKIKSITKTIESFSTTDYLMNRQKDSIDTVDTKSEDFQMKIVSDMLSNVEMWTVQCLTNLEQGEDVFEDGKMIEWNEMKELQ